LNSPRRSWRTCGVSTKGMTHANCIDEQGAEDDEADESASERCNRGRNRARSERQARSTAPAQRDASCRQAHGRCQQGCGGARPCEAHAAARDSGARSLAQRAPHAQERAQEPAAPASGRAADAASARGGAYAQAQGGEGSGAERLSPCLERPCACSSIHISGLTRPRRVTRAGPGSRRVFAHPPCSERDRPGVAHSR